MDQQNQSDSCAQSGGLDGATGRELTGGMVSETVGCGLESPAVAWSHLYCLHVIVFLGLLYHMYLVKYKSMTNL